MLVYDVIVYSFLNVARAVSRVLAQVSWVLDRIKLFLTSGKTSQQVSCVAAPGKLHVKNPRASAEKAIHLALLGSNRPIMCR